jgi:DNA mismatch repair protein MSH5
MPFVTIVRWNAAFGCAYIDITRIVEESGGVFQIRPRKDFHPVKGRDRILSLRLLTDFCVGESETRHSNEVGHPTSGPRNAYDFMTGREEDVGDPITKKWNAAIRLSNFASPESSPLCVGPLTYSLIHFI